MNLILKTHIWGEAKAADLHKVLLSAKKLLDANFGSLLINDIWVYQNLARGNPITLYERGLGQEYKIELCVTDRLWAKYAYQFSHEYCHVRTNHMVGTQRCKWFEETLCETASIYTLRRMAEVWAEKPPYPNWRDYSSSLFDYADEFIGREVHQLPEGTDFSGWLNGTLPELEKNQYLREHNARIAIKLLDIFEDDPHLWSSMGYFNTWAVDPDDDIHSCLGKLEDVVPKENKSGVKTLAEFLK